MTNTLDQASAKIDAALDRGDTPDDADLTPEEALALLDDLKRRRAISRLRADTYARRINKWRRRRDRILRRPQ